MSSKCFTYMHTNLIGDVTSAQTTDFSLIQLLPNGKVNANNLHLFLRVKTKFADWIKRLISDYDFQDGKDFLKIEKPLENNKTDYELSLDMAKEICMVSKSQKGKGARKYFIACEQKALTTTAIHPQQPLSLTEVLEQSQAWIMTLAQENTTLKLQVNESKEVIVTQTDKINELAPKAKFIDETFVNTTSLTAMNMFAKEINIGIVALYKLLRDNHIWFYALDQYNKPHNNVHAKYINNGCFEIKQTYSERLNQCFDKIFVTPKGKLLCYKLVRESEELKNSVIDGNTSIVKVNYYGKH